jgi:hypothetical protein
MGGLRWLDLFVPSLVVIASAPADHDEMMKDMPGMK